MEMDFMDRVGPVIDETIKSLARKKFIEDPIAGDRHSRNTSIISSAYKRHGRILETALRESLRDSNRHRVWKEDVFKVSRAADQRTLGEGCLASNPQAGKVADGGFGVELPASSRSSRLARCNSCD